MKRITIVLALILLFSGCSEKVSTENASYATENIRNSLAEMAIVGEDFEPTQIDVEWTENSIVDENIGWRLCEADFDNLDLDMSLACCHRTVLDEAENEDEKIAVRQMGLDGAVMREVWVTEAADPLVDITATVFIEDRLWLARRYKTVIDNETGQYSAEFHLECWSDAGELLLTIPVDETFGVGEEGIMYAALSAVPGGKLFLKHSFGMFLLDEDGAILASEAFDEDTYGMCFDATGTPYLMMNNSTGICPVDWESLTVGYPILSVGFDEIVEPGSGPYDFFLRSSRTLKGVCVQNRSITTILNWEDCNIADPSGVVYLDEDTLLVGVYSIFSGSTRYLTMDRVPVWELPEKTTVQLAVAMHSGLAEQGFRWQDCTGHLDEMISDFCLSTDYEIEVSVFSEASELNLLMLSEDPPDMIWWDNLDMETTLRSYIRNGYLENMTPRFEGEADLALDNFLPQIIEASTAADGGIYAMPSQVFLNSIIGRQDLVGTKEGWSYDEFFASVEALPEGVPIHTYSASSALLVYICYNLGDFIDLDHGTCDFTGDTFQRLLALCKEHFPADVDDIVYFDDLLAAAYAGEVMTTDAYFMGSAAYWAELLGEHRSAGMTVVGYPGVGGNGTVMQMMDACSITTCGNQQEAAWAFLKQIYGSDYQSSFYGGDRTVRSDCLEEYARWEHKAFNYTCEEEELQAALALYRGAVVEDAVDSVLLDVVIEEAEAYFQGEKTAMEVGEILNNRIQIYISEQS